MFGLVAHGTYDWCDGRHVIVCKIVFTTKEKAEAYTPTFRQKCTTPRDEYDMRFLQDNDKLIIELIEYDVE
jgi:hypothetical protein